MIRFITLAIGLVLAGMSHASGFHFQSPSGNIRCVLATADGMNARCDLTEAVRSFADRPESCDAEWGMSFGVGTTGKGRVNCKSDAIDGPADPLVLPYGTRVTAPEITCRSELAGITCTNSQGGGFSVRRAAQSIF